jgi:hypothetical protein
MLDEGGSGMEVDKQRNARFRPGVIWLFGAILLSAP